MTTSQSHHGPRAAFFASCSIWAGRSGPRSASSARTQSTISRWVWNQPSGFVPYLARIVVHAEAEQPPVRRGDERRDVRPVLDVRRASGEEQSVQRRGVVRTQTREQRHVVRPGEDVHRVDLQRRHARHGQIQLPGAGDRGPGLREPLSGERDPARLRGAQRLLHGGQPSRGLRHGSGAPAATADTRLSAARPSRAA